LTITIMMCLSIQSQTIDIEKVAGLNGLGLIGYCHIVPHTCNYCVFL
jgi:DMSO/TMAO reductase YedYZ heme-binding membrane subunit